MILRLSAPVPASLTTVASLPIDPEYAKAVGTEYAHGRFIVRMDSDEEFSYPEQMQEKERMEQMLEAVNDMRNNLDKGYEEAAAVVDSLDLKGF